ncbi:hypothetical protein [Brachybacterium sacelli]|uniref:DUF3180 domain-containing protein n=1 Tax=Brachybacterium sacelli TaxID=173364 RepID=A0ABS4X2N7_9MICO|nr:hypothetical protein [Brachybacterium sacelli]MBP2382717.1 hypothetical protein [Brachybacterium sacelli]
MTTSRRTRIISYVVGGTAAAALGAVPLHRLPRPIRIGYVLAPAVLTMGVTLFSLRARDTGAVAAPGAGNEPEDTGTTNSEEDGHPEPWVGRIGLSLALGAVLAGAGAAWIRIDHRLETALRSRGVAAPRLVLGLATGALTVAVTALEQESGKDPLTSSASAP